MRKMKPPEFTIKQLVAIRASVSWHMFTNKELKSDSMEALQLIVDTINEYLTYLQDSHKTY